MKDSATNKTSVEINNSIINELFNFSTAPVILTDNKIHY